MALYPKHTRWEVRLGCYNPAEESFSYGAVEAFDHEREALDEVDAMMASWHGPDVVNMTKVKMREAYAGPPIMVVKVTQQVVTRTKEIAPDWATEPA